MKTSLHTPYYIIMHLLAALLLSLTSCEKPIYEEEGGTAQGDSGSTTEQGSGTGGWANDDTGDTMDPISVTQFKTATYTGSVRVRGYVVGCATGAANKAQYDFLAPYDHNTALLLADTKDCQDTARAMTVQLKSGTKMRRELNLVDNPAVAGRIIEVQGKQSTYIRLRGIKDVEEYTMLSE